MDQLERIGKYDVVRPLGMGGFGEVFLVRHPELAVLRAVKMLRYGTGGPQLEEAVLQAQLEHERIVRCMDVGTQEGRPYLVMEYLPGGSLADLLEKGPLEIDRALTIARDLALALAHAHSQSVIHRDLKPANVLLTDEGRAKIADFGLARLLDQQSQHQSGIAGTVNYLAPEQLSGEATPKSDLWSLGCLLQEMINGRPPFAGKGDYHTMKAIAEQDPEPVSAPAEVSALVRTLLSKEPSGRPASAELVAEELGRLVNSAKPAPARQTGPVTMESDDWPMVGGDPGRSFSKMPDLARSLVELWRYQAPGPVLSPPAICRGRIFLGTTEDKVVCLDMISGRAGWAFDCGANAFPSPVAMGTACLAVSHDGTVHALGAANGRVIWQARPGGEMLAPPSLTGFGVVAADLEGWLYVLDPAAGDTKAAWNLGSPVEAAPLVAGSMIVAAAISGRVVAVDPLADGMIWSQELGDTVEAAPAARQGALFVQCVGGGLHCLDLDTGAERWRAQVGAPAVAAPVIDENGLLTADMEGLVTSLDPSSGQLRWQRRLAAPLSAAPCAAGALAVLAERGGGLTLLERTEGEEVFRVDLGTPLAASPVVWRDVVIAAAVDGLVHALGRGE